MRWATMTFALVVVLTAVPACTNSKTGVDAYEKGDYATALMEFRVLAEQGDAIAQYNLGLMYANGRGVPRDYVQARMWFNLAAAQDNETARTLRDKLAKKMTPAQLDEAQRLAREWKLKRK